ncbi:MAG: DUF1800 family protein [Caldilineaceae bacterium]
MAHAETIGYDAFLEEQLAPQSLADAAGDAAIAKVAILGLSRAELYRMHNNDDRCRKALIDGFLARTVHSRRQLLERVVEFWADHFNISTDAYVPDLVIFQREAIRKHAFGRFRDLLLATAKAPAMLYYLDNYVNVAAHPNENYARELLELHTLGVDGGYTETDVKEIAAPSRGGRFTRAPATVSTSIPSNTTATPRLSSAMRCPAAAASKARSTCCTSSPVTRPRRITFAPNFVSASSVTVHRQA